MFGWEIEIAVIGEVILLGVGWKAVGGGCIYQSRPIQQQQEIGAADHRWMDGKDDISLRWQCCTWTWKCMCRCLFCIHEKFVGLTGRPSAQLWLREVN